MKRKLLFAMLCIISAWVNTYADVTWTDKTSVITNPSFETNNAIANLTSCGWATDRVTGWTIAPSSPGNSQVGVGNSSSTIQGIATSFSPSEGSNYFYMRENWNPNTTFSISQTIPDGNIPAGIYRLTVKAAMFSSVASTYTLSLQEEGQTAATNSFSHAGTANSESWRDWSVMLIKQEDNTDLTITAAYKTPSENSGGKHYALLVDDVKLEYIAPSSVSSTNTFDMTSWVANPSFELNTFNGTQADGSTSAGGGQRKKPTGYTCYFNVSGWEDCAANTTNPADGTYCMNAWFGGITEMKFYQTIDYLPEGVYEISAQVRTDQTSTDGIYTYGIAGGQEYKSASWDASKMAGTWNSMDNWQTLTARASVIGGGSLQFGLRSDKFVQFDDFHLNYLGSDLLLAELKSSFSTKQTTANGLLSNSDYNNVVGTERTNLTTKKGVTPEETVAGWTTAVNELQEAIEAFTAAKTNYDALAREITKAAALGFDASEYAATSSSTAASALTATQGIKVAEYNLVNNTYQYGVELGTWTTTGPTGSLSDQHYKGSGHSYLEQSSAAWGQNSWTIKYEQDLTLPAGDYVFKVAGRQAASDGVTLSLTVKNGETVLGTVADFPRGDTGLGINTSGATDFTTGEGHEYVNGGAGRGWEWRYVKFTLSSDATVNVAVDAVATTNHMWVSFCDATVQTNNEANISLIAYNIALGSAQTTIANTDYTNVTGSEKTALQNAIAADGSLDKTDNEAIVAATTALDEARVAFVDAKSAYDTFVAAKAVSYENNLPYASPMKFAAIATAQAATATSASDATTKTNAILSAYRKYVESNALAEGVTGAENKTSLISDPNMDVTYDGTEHTFGAWQVIGQTDGTIQLLNGESFTDGDGNSNYKYADIYKSDNNAGIQQTLTNLAPGRYLLTVTARAQATDGATFRVFAGSTTADITRIGNSGGVFDRGWNDISVEFNVLSESDVNIGVQSGNGKSLWWSATRFRLVKLPTPEVALSEETEWTPEACEYANVTLTRTFNSNWATFVVPFDIDNATLTAQFGDDVEVSEFTAENNEGVTFTPMTTPAITANKPVIMKTSTNESSFSFNGVSIVAGTPTFSQNGVNFVGNYGGDITIPNTLDTYYIVSNQIKKSTGNQRIKGFRAYFTVDADAAPGVKAFFENGDIETSIASIMAKTSGNEHIYNLNGQRVNKAQKGIYIINGKKVAVK